MDKRSWQMRRAPIVLLLVALNFAEGVIHLVYGSGCWGFQPGGHYSMLMAVGLVLTFIATVVWALMSVRRLLEFVSLALATILGSAAILVSYTWVGWRLFTTIHNQGPENLLFIAALDFGVLVVLGASSLLCAQRRDKHASGTAPLGNTVRQC